MLKGIDNRLNADVLRVLRAMGHGDVLIVADTNFPSDSVARATVTGELLRMENLTSAEAVQPSSPSFRSTPSSMISRVGWKWSATLPKSPRSSRKCRQRLTAPKAARAR